VTSVYLPRHSRLRREKNPLWWVLVPLLRFTFDCWLGLGAFAVISFLACGLWGMATLRHKPKLRSFSRYSNSLNGGQS
jgi:hypothetical protein